MELGDLPTTTKKEGIIIVSKLHRGEMKGMKVDYQLMPALTDEEFQALKADIAAQGILVPIEVDEHGNILDGHHRVNERPSILPKEEKWLEERKNLPAGTKARYMSEQPNFVPAGEVDDSKDAESIIPLAERDYLATKKVFLALQHMVDAFDERSTLDDLEDLVFRAQDKIGELSGIAHNYYHWDKTVGLFIATSQP